MKSKKIHLIGGILNTICGKQLECVKYSIDKANANCISCLNQAHINYPKIARKITNH